VGHTPRASGASSSASIGDSAIAAIFVGTTGLSAA